jgi:hypothetical protein
MVDNLNRDEDLKRANAELVSESIVVKKRNLLLEKLHKKDADLIKELMSQLGLLQQDKKNDRKQLHDVSKSSEKTIQELELRVQSLDQGNTELELSKDKEIRQLIDKYESELKKKDNII